MTGSRSAPARILVVWSSGFGSTAEVARAIGDTLSSANARVDVASVADIEDVTPYDAVIVDEAHDPASDHPFKGNVDIAKLDRLVQEVGANRVPYISLEGCVNMAGGQPFSMANLRELHAYCRKHDIKIMLEPRTRLGISDEGGGELRVILYRGAILAWVSPIRLGPAFTVTTDAGDIRVKGTVFSVSTSANNRVGVAVLRGSVGVIPQGARRKKQVVRGEHMELGTLLVQKISDERAEKMRADLLTLEEMAIRADS